MRIILLLAALPLLGGCDQIKERVGIPDPARMEAEGMAIGGGCRNSGRGLEECYRLNPGASKAAIFAGWKEMNEYMAENKMQAVPPTMSGEAGKGRKAAEEEGDAKESAGKKAAGH